MICNKDVYYWRHIARIKMNYISLCLSSEWVLTRTACLGNDVYNMLSLSMPRLNVQKGRVDYWVRINEHPGYKVQARKVYEHLERKDIYPLIIQEGLIALRPVKAPKFFLMDSFAELTDQLFVHRKEEWGFCSHYSDLHVNNAFNSKFSCEGLLAEEDMYQHYAAFFSLFRECYGKVPIIFLHFPTKLDHRAVFQKRSLAIHDAITRVSKEFPLFYSIMINDDCVDWPEDGFDDSKFPYHFNTSTYKRFVDGIISCGVLSK